MRMEYRNNWKFVARIPPTERSAALADGASVRRRSSAATRADEILQGILDPWIIKPA